MAWPIAWDAVLADLEAAQAEAGEQDAQPSPGEAGGEAVAVRADVSSDADVSAMIGAAEETFGALHVLFNNAGIMHGADGNAQ